MCEKRFLKVNKQETGNSVDQGDGYGVGLLEKPRVSRQGMDTPAGICRVFFKPKEKKKHECDDELLLSSARSLQPHLNQIWKDGFQ